ncbi:MAG: ribosome silencing factor [Sphaerochaetaceae bacterium]|nr:ribosome silencing factor [Sphaerochaetaceae bacterium]
MTEQLSEDVNVLKHYLEEQNCKDVNVIDVEGRCSWADVLIIATVTSVAHLRGVAHELWGELNDLGLEVTDRHKTPAGDGWELIDTGSIVIHLMSAELRDFYSLEKLWKNPEA